VVYAGELKTFPGAKSFIVGCSLSFRGDSMSLEALEKRVTELEEKIRSLLLLVDPDRHPFTYLTLEMNLTKGQVDRIFDLMDETRKSLSSPNPMHHGEFERRVYSIVPAHDRDYHFAEDIVRTLADTDQYTDVYDHMRKSGMNLGPREKP
jgi:hypothetical protein